MVFFSQTKKQQQPNRFQFMWNKIYNEKKERWNSVLKQYSFDEMHDRDVWKAKGSLKQNTIMKINVAREYRMRENAIQRQWIQRGGKHYVEIISIETRARFFSKKKGNNVWKLKQTIRVVTLFSFCANDRRVKLFAIKRNWISSIPTNQQYLFYFPIEKNRNFSDFFKINFPFSYFTRPATVRCICF